MKNKTLLVNFALILLLFTVSVIVRKDNLQAPIGRHHEWLTGHVLGTVEVLQENGIAYHHHSPVFTFNAKADKYLVSSQKFKDSNNYAYYVSYPPACFLLPYCIFNLSGQKASVTGIRIISLLNHFLCALLVYLLVLRIFRKKIKQDFFIPAFIAYTMYLFATGNLWFHAHVYFADMQVHLFILTALYVTYSLFDNPEYKFRLKLLILGAATFMGVYTEWLAVFIAFFTAGFFLLLSFKNRKFLYPFLIICCCTLAPMLLTVYQYSRIAGLEPLKEHLTNKFMARSGYDKEAAYGGMSIHSKVARAKLFSNYETNYDELLDFAWLSLYVLAFVLLVRNIREKAPFTKNHFRLFAIVFLAIIIHHIVFFNFTVVHDFSGFKCSLLLPLFIAYCFGLLFVAIAGKYEKVCAITMSLVCIYFVHFSIQKYYKVNPLDWRTNLQRDIGEEIEANSTEDEVIFAKAYVTPEISWYAKRNVVEIGSIEDAKKFLKQMNYKRGHYVEVKFDDTKYLINSYRIVNDTTVQKIKAQF